MSNEADNIEVPPLEFGTPKIEKIEMGFKLILEGLGLPLDDPHIIDTPARAAHAWFHELCSGLTTERPPIKAFKSTADEMILLREIPIRSLCAHHLLPFYGHATIAYIPGKGEVLGLSKLSRIADYWARRPQVQEELTVQIADYLDTLVTSYKTDAQPKGGVGVVIEAEHMCMAMRGVTHRGKMVTSAVRGVFHTNVQTRQEFMALTRGIGYPTA